MPLPPKSPELNPVENIWQFIRDHWLSNRVFQSYDDIVDHCCFAWNRLVDQPWTIMSIGLRNWAHRSRSAGLGIRRERRGREVAPKETIDSAARGRRVGNHRNAETFHLHRPEVRACCQIFCLKPR